MNMKTKLSMLSVLAVLMLSILLTACAGTKTTDSWTNQSYKGQIKNIYIIGLAKDELNRMAFEDTFESLFVRQGVKAVSSYKDLLPLSQKQDREDIIQRMTALNCDSIMLTRLVGKRRSGFMTGGKETYVYSPRPYSGDPTPRRIPIPTYYNPGSLNVYSGWSNYYTYGTMNSVGTSKTDFIYLTVESVLYDLQTEEMIWSAQMETYLEGNMEKMVKAYADEVIRNLKKSGLI
jgi:hypothetical protein